MNNLFKCQNCGAENRAGQVSCNRCMTRFQYRCPRCQSTIMGGDAACQRCGQQLNWPTRDPVDDGDKEKQNGDSKPGSALSWILPLVGLILILAAAGAGIYWVKMMTEEPQLPAISDNYNANEKDSGFTPDLSGPGITNLELKNLNFNTVDISWTTDEPSNSQLIWRIKDGTPQSTAIKEALVTEHLIELTNLKNKATYFYQVRSVDQAGNETISAEKTFDIGIQRGTLKVGVAWSAIKTIEQQPSVFKTIINGQIKNTGEATLSIREIEVVVTVTVSGRQGVSEVRASLDPYPLDISPQALHKFTVEVPNRTEPVYSVEARIIAE